MSNKDTYVPKNSIRRAIQEFLSRMASAFEDRTLNTYDPLSEGFITGKALKKVLDDLPVPITPKGSILFTNLPSVDDADVGDMYNIKDGFVSTTEFEGGADVAYEAGTNVVCCKYGGVKKWDSFSTPITYVTDSAPIGAITAFAGATIPIGYLLCDGSEQKISSYPALAAVLGTLYGTASDPDYFVLPDLREAVPKGAGLTGKAVGAHVKAGGLSLGEFIDDRVQEHYHKFGSVDAQVGLSDHSAYYKGKALSTGNGTVYNTTSDTGDRKGVTTEVKSVGVNYIIKAK